MKTKLVLRGFPSGYTENHFLNLLQSLSLPAQFIHFLPAKSRQPTSNSRGGSAFVTLPVKEYNDSLGKLLIEFQPALYKQIDELNLQLKAKFESSNIQTQSKPVQLPNVNPVIEFAPNQRLPRPAKFKDTKLVNTLEEDSDYKAFLEGLNCETTSATFEPTNAPQNPAQNSAPKKPQATIIDYLIKKRSEKKILLPLQH